MKTIAQRLTEPTPKLFKRIRNTGLAIAAAGTAVLSATVALPAILVTVAGYLVVAGSVAAAVSQIVTEEE